MCHLLIHEQHRALPGLLACPPWWKVVLVPEPTVAKKRTIKLTGSRNHKVVIVFSCVGCDCSSNLVDELHFLLSRRKKKEGWV